MTSQDIETGGIETGGIEAAVREGSDAWLLTGEQSKTPTPELPTSGAETRAFQETRRRAWAGWRRRQVLDSAHDSKSAHDSVRYDARS
jgi:hypothetical protein